MSINEVLGMFQLTAFFDVSITAMAHANGATLICQGLGNLLWMYASPCSRPIMINQR